MAKFQIAFVACLLVASALASVDLAAVYVHQKWDTPDWFSGGWACGPTSAVMAAASLGKLPAHPINISSPHLHSNNWGWYVPSKFTLYGHTFNEMQKDASGHDAWGAYGTCTQGGAAWAMKIVTFLQDLKLNAVFHGSPSYTQVKDILSKKHFIVLSTQLTSAGHLILLRGWADNGNLIANDPWGNANEAGYGTKMNGANVQYTWAKVSAKWMVEVWAP